MNLQSSDSWQNLQLNPAAVLDEICASLQFAYTRAWLHNDVTPRAGLRFPVTALDPSSNLASPLPRRWAVAENLGRKKLGCGISNLTRHDDASFHPLIAQLARCERYLIAVESTVLELASRLTPWFGQGPIGFDWVISTVDAPVVTDLGYWLSTITYSLDEGLTEIGQVLPVVAGHNDLPVFWKETAADAVKWELAVSLGLTVRWSYGPPVATRDRPYSELQNPFLVVLDLWCAGVMLQASFMGDIATLCIDSKFLQSLS